MRPPAAISAGAPMATNICGPPTKATNDPSFGNIVKSQFKPCTAELAVITFGYHKVSCFCIIFVVRIIKLSICTTVNPIVSHVRVSSTITTSVTRVSNSFPIPNAANPLTFQPTITTVFPKCLRHSLHSASYCPRVISPFVSFSFKHLCLQVT